MTGNFNLRSCAQSRYNPIYLDPFLFLVILYFDYNRTFESNIVWYMYVALVVQRFIAYVLFMKNMIEQLTEHLGIPFLAAQNKNKKDAKYKW